VDGYPWKDSHCEVWVMNGKVADLLAYWNGQSGNIMVKEVWRMAPLCLF
jgi:hypothetical protein